MKPLQIILRQAGDPLVRFAAEELQRYILKLFGFHPPVFHTPSEEQTTYTILIGGFEQTTLSDQGYVICRVRHESRPAVMISGGSPRAILWAVYELISQWGVHYLVQGDVFPENPGMFRLPDNNVEREPVFRCREFRVLNDMANSGIFWSVKQHQDLFNQLVKLRFSGIKIATYSHQPWAHFSFGDVERCSGDLCYGFRHRIHGQTIGSKLFGSVPYHTNPEFQGAETYEDRIACGKRLMRGIISSAHEQGLDVTYCHPLSEVPDEFIEPLLAKSTEFHLPEDTISQTHFARLGLVHIGGNGPVEKYRTPLNPAYIDLMETSLIAHIKAYPDADCYCLNEQENPPGGAGVRECWDILNRKYDLESVLSLDELRARAGKQFFYTKDRALTQALAAIQTLRLYDILINEHDILQHASSGDARFRVSFFSEHVQALVPKVLHEEKCQIEANIDYLPARAAERMDTLAFARTSKMDVIMTATIEDDNVGFLPQLVTPDLFKIVKKMRQYGLTGYSFRQFDMSQHEPSMAYLIEAAWDDTITPQDTYRRYALRVAGKQAVADLLDAFKDIEELTDSSNKMMGLGFMMPHIYSKHWKPGLKPDPAWNEYIGRLEMIITKLKTALGKCDARGKKYVRNYLKFIRFNSEFVQTQDLILQARRIYDEAQKVKETGNHMHYHSIIGRASDLLFEATEMSAGALTTWSELTADPTDLGTLAGLNAYGHDWLTGKSTEVYWESQEYGGNEFCIPRAVTKLKNIE